MKRSFLMTFAIGLLCVAFLRLLADSTHADGAVLPVSPSNAGITSMPAASATATVCVPNYSFTVGQGAIAPGTVDIGNHCDDCVTTISLPFPVPLYGLNLNSASISSNGNVQFTSNSGAFNNTCLPAAGFITAVLPFWDDLRTDGAGGAAGIFTSTTGTAPNRILNREWRACIRPSSGACAGVDTQFEVRLYEGTGQVEMIYGLLTAPTSDGSSATVGVQRDTGSRFTEFSCNMAALSTGLKLTFTLDPCETATATLVPPTSTSTSTQAPSSTNMPSNTATSTATYTVTRTPTPVPPTGTGSPTRTSCARPRVASATSSSARTPASSRAVWPNRSPHV